MHIQQDESSPPGIMFARNKLRQPNELVPLGRKFLLNLRLKLVKLILGLANFSRVLVLESLAKRSRDVVDARFF